MWTAKRPPGPNQAEFERFDQVGSQTSRGPSITGEKLVNRARRTSHGAVSRNCALLMSMIIVASSSTRCAISSKAAVSETRLAPTGLSPGSKAAVVLNQSQACAGRAEGTCWLGSKSSARERRLARRMGRVMRKSYPSMQLLSPEQFRLAALPGPDLLDSPLSGEAAIRRIGDAGAAARADDLGVRYLIIVDAQRTRSGAIDWDVEEGGWWIAREWTKVSLLSAEIVDLERASLSGKLLSTSSGTSAIGVFFLLYVIPLPPIGWSSMPERKASKALGRAIARFIASDDSVETPPSGHEENSEQQARPRRPLQPHPLDLPRHAPEAGRPPPVDAPPPV